MAEIVINSTCQFDSSTLHMLVSNPEYSLNNKKTCRDIVSVLLSSVKSSKDQILIYFTFRLQTLQLIISPRRDRTTMDTKRPSGPLSGWIRMDSDGFRWISMRRN